MFVLSKGATRLANFLPWAELLPDTKSGLNPLKCHYNSCFQLIPAVIPLARPMNSELNETKELRMYLECVFSFFIKQYYKSEETPRVHPRTKNNNDQSISSKDELRNCLPNGDHHGHDDRVLPRAFCRIPTKGQHWWRPKPAQGQILGKNIWQVGPRDSASEFSRSGRSAKLHYESRDLWGLWQPAFAAVLATLECDFPQCRICSQESQFWAHARQVKCSKSERLTNRWDVS